MLQTFVRIVEAGSLSAAATLLGTTQPRTQVVQPPTDEPPKYGIRLSDQQAARTAETTEEPATSEAPADRPADSEAPSGDSEAQSRD